MIEQRRVRFADIEGIAREDLPLACEVWLEDLFKASWVTREAMKLAVHLTRYMGRANPATLNFREIECTYQLPQEEVRKALVLLRSYGAVEGFVCERDDLKVSLNLTLQQRLRVLETRQRFNAALGRPRHNAWPWSAPRDRWLPSPTPAATAPGLAAAS